MNGYEEYGLRPSGKGSGIPMQGFDIVPAVEAASALFQGPESGSKSMSIAMNDEPSCGGFSMLVVHVFTSVLVINHITNVSFTKVKDVLTLFLLCLSMQRPSLQSNHLSSLSPQ